VAEHDVLTDQRIQTLYSEEFLSKVELGGEWADWLQEYTKTLDAVAAQRANLSAPDLQQILWEDNGVSGAGMCSVQLAPAIAKDSFRTAVSDALASDLPADLQSREQRLQAVHKRLRDECGKLLTRMPWVKIMRALAAAYPDAVTCVIDHSRLRTLAKGLLPDLQRGDLGLDNLVALHVRILDRIDKALTSPFESDSDGLAKRSMFAWLLFKNVEQQAADTDGVDQEEKRPGQEVPTIRFLPQERRRAGITAITGYLNTALKLLDHAESGVTLDEAVGFIQEEFPQLQQSSAKTYVSVVRHQLGLLALERDVLKPSSLGQRCLDSGETEDIRNLLIPRVLKTVNGYDCILHTLRQKGDTSRVEMLSALRGHYSPWTADFAPNSQLKWAESLGLIETKPEGALSLTDAGRFWAAAVPTDLSPVPIEGTPGDTPGESPKEGGFRAPSVQDLLARIGAYPLVFPRELIVRLHVALHANPRKHFVLLSGLSGTGKTKLAQVYAEVYHAVPSGEANEFFCLIAVQPDWTDPTGLLGYINPLHETTTYEVTACLRFLRHCHEFPNRPHFLCLDEMNLARVEYYFAPFLSAMESGLPVQIHQQPDPVDGVEPRIEWPDNLFVLGTVNMDETTYAFSDKVLDRAFSIEFWDVDLDAFAAKFAAALPGMDTGLFKHTIEDLKRLSEILAPVHLHFGYRTAEEVIRFVAGNAEIEKFGLPVNGALDHAVFMKILPKVRGQDTPRLRTCLQELQTFAVQHQLPETKRKVALMAEELVSTGTTRFWR
jgi:5-methylcytosine-specific restriction protein B